MATAKPYINGLQPYHPGKPVAAAVRQYGLAAEDVLKLGSNENPLGMSPLAAQAIQDAAGQASCYPEQFELLAALASFYKIEYGQLLLGNGSNDILDLIARTFLGTGDQAIVSAYAFAMYHIAVQSVGADTITVPARAFGHDLTAMRSAITPHTKAIWIANPNNPTGTFIPYDVLQAWIETIPQSIIIVLDEAYYEYLKIGDQEASHQWVADYPNLIVVRTFSKIYGLAGLRIGYGIAAPAVAEKINRVRQPFNVNSIAVAAATAALQDPAFVLRSYAMASKGREYLLDKLAALQLPILPAYGNFVTVQVPAAQQVAGHLLEKGIIVRPLASYGLAEWLRITVGLPEDNQRFILALTAILGSRTA